MRANPHVLALALTGNLLIILIAIAMGYFWSPDHDPDLYFREGRWIPAVRSLEMMCVSCFAMGVYARRRQALLPAGKKSFRVWVIIAAVFAILALGDALQIHERFDRWLRASSHSADPGFIARVDITVVVSYVLLGMAVLWGYRRELLQFRAMWPALLAGIAFTLASVVSGAIAHWPDFFKWAGANAAFARRLECWFGAWDGGFQLLALGAFVASFYLAYQQSRSPVLPP